MEGKDKSKFLFNIMLIVIAIGIIATIFYGAIGEFNIVISIVIFTFITSVLLKIFETIIEILQSIDEKMKK